MCRDRGEACGCRNVLTEDSSMLIGEINLSLVHQGMVTFDWKFNNMIFAFYACFLPLQLKCYQINK